MSASLATLEYKRRPTRGPQIQVLMDAQVSLLGGLDRSSLLGCASLSGEVKAAASLELALHPDLPPIIRTNRLEIVSPRPIPQSAAPSSRPASANTSWDAAGGGAGFRGVAMKKPYTQKQGQYLAFIYYCSKIHGRAPAEAEMQQYLRVSPPAVHQMILTLKARRPIERTPGRARSLRLHFPPEESPDIT